MAIMVFFVIVSVWTPMIDDYVNERWFGNVSWLWVMPALTLITAGLVYSWLRKGHDALPFIGTIALFGLFMPAYYLASGPT